jgi:putative tricarboxylic transport membrane protein
VKVSDAVSGAFFILFAGLVFYLSKDLRLMPGQNYGGAFFPRVIASCMALLGLILLVRGIRERGSVPWVEGLDWVRSPRHIGNFVLVVAVLVFYILVSDKLGFILTGFTSLFVLLMWLRGPSHWLQALIVSAVCVLGMQYFFGEFLRVPLPWGVLQPIAW